MQSENKYREYVYSNEYGVKKLLCVNPKGEDGKYHITVFTYDHGELCGDSYISDEKLEEFFNHYPDMKERRVGDVPTITEGSESV